MNRNVRSLVGLLAILLAFASVACSGGEPDNESESDPQAGSTPEPCEAPDFAPTYIPWDKSGSIPKPEVIVDDRDTVLLWLGPPGEEQPTAKVDLATHYELRVVHGGETVSVRGTEGQLTWSGSAAYEWALRWTESDEPCGHYGLYFSDVELSKKQMVPVLMKIAGSLK